MGLVQFKTYEIWIGFFCGEQGYRSTEPQFIATVEAVNFKTACIKHELLCKMERIAEGEKAGNLNDQDYEWFFSPRVIGNWWIGKYYQSKEEAEKSFKDAI